MMNDIIFDVEDVVSWCENEIQLKIGDEDNKENYFKKNGLNELGEFIECCKDLLEECIYLNESVFLKDKSIRIRKVFLDGDKNEVWIGEWEEMLDRMRDGMVGYYRFGESGQRVLEEMSCKVTPFACKVKMEKEERR